MSAYGGGYSTTSYGGGGDDAGAGGYMWGSQAGSQSATKAINEESLRPVTIKQIIDAEPSYAGDANFRIDALDVKQVTLVGMVRSITPQTTNITYKVDDGTGTIEVKLWLDSDKQESDAAPQFKEEDYVRVWGRLKSFGNKRHVGAHVIKPIRDFNEVNYHLLEATYVHLYFTRGAPPQDGGPVGGGGDDGGMFVDSGNDTKLRGCSNKARQMYNYLSGVQDSNGVNMHVLARETGLTIQEAMRASEELLGNGSIYTTVDDETFAVLESY
ncbi:replication protein A, subunit RPA32 [Xylariaceae sp. FL1272]|nr:replication protein A, subunit RPA32 [Xylariaceae sp. FL1272]